MATGKRPIEQPRRDQVSPINPYDVPSAQRCVEVLDEDGSRLVSYYYFPHKSTDAHARRHAEALGKVISLMRLGK